jgi:SAM-dependent methyltransferase
MTKKPEHMEHKYFDVLDNADDHDNYFSPVIRALNDFTDLDGKRVLDVGCGTGKFVFQLFNHCQPEIVGVDGPTSVASRAVERGYKEVAVVDDLSVDPLPFQQDYFDCVICKDVMEHLLDPKFTLSEINKVLRVGGTFLFHVPNHFPLSGRLRFLMNNKLDTFNYFSPNESRWSFPHIRFYEHADIIKVFNDHGFDVVEDLSYTFAAVPILGRFRVLDGFVRWLVKTYPNNFAEGFTLIATKKDRL